MTAIAIPVPRTVAEAPVSAEQVRALRIADCVTFTITTEGTALLIARREHRIDYPASDLFFFPQEEGVQGRSRSIEVEVVVHGAQPLTQDTDLSVTVATGADPTWETTTRLLRAGMTLTLEWHLDADPEMAYGLGLRFEDIQLRASHPADERDLCFLITRRAVRTEGPLVQSQAVRE